jgi:translation initiation factor IF-2
MTADESREFMASSNEQEKKESDRLERPGRLELRKTVETGQIRQSFSHGRSRTVTVEVKRKRTYAPSEGGAMREVPRAPAMDFGAPAAPALAEAVRQPEIAAPAALSRRPATLRSLTEEEKEARARAVHDARIEQAESKRRAEADLSRRETEADEARRLAEEEEVRLAAEEELRRTVEAEAAGKLAEEEEARLRAKEAEGKKAPGRAGEAPAAPREIARTEEEEAEEAEKARRGKPAAPRHPAAKRAEHRRREGKLTIAQALEGGAQERMRSMAALRRAREKEKQKARETHAAEPAKKVTRDVVVPESIAVQELANRMAERGADVVKALMKLGVMVTITQMIDGDTAELVVNEFGHRVKRVSEADVEIGLKDEGDDLAALEPRAPVVTVMGHVDHGKTSLLDALRKTDVVSGEAGGITQHIGAYQVTLKSGAHITFLDTPGHEAFSAMRARGANITDIVVLVVAADDGVKDQTVEAIHHAQAAQVPIIVAINKIDKPDANPQRVRTELLQHGIVLESVGGDVLSVEVSAKEKRNLDKLEEMILLQSEVLELRANPARPAQGVVIEARLERGRGPVATVLVQRGTLKVGDIFVAGPEWGRVRALADNRRRSIESAGPSVPVEVLGLNGTPSAGDDFAVVENEARAREITSYRARQVRGLQRAAGPRGTIEQMITAIRAGEAKELPVVVKADVQGSLEAIVSSLDKMETEEVKTRVLHGGVGGINESDITLAASSKAIVLGFNVRANAQARDLARRDGVDIRYYSVIYDIINDIKAALSGMLAPTVKERALGAAEVREVFGITKVGKIAGCMVTEGVVRRGAKIRLLRDSVVVFEGTVGTLRRFKDEVKEVKEGFECGIGIENYQDIQTGDVIECYELEEIARSI